MADPYDAFSSKEDAAAVDPAKPYSTPAPAPTQAAADPYDAFSSKEDPAAVDPAKPYSTPAHEFDGKLGLMWGDRHATTQQIRDLATAAHRQLPDHIDDLFHQREKLIASGGNPAGTVNPQSTDAPVSGQVDNREQSFLSGVADGGEHVSENIAGGLGYVGNKLGITNDLRGDLHNWYQRKVDASPYRGSEGGYITGEIAAAGAGSLLAAPALDVAGLGAGAGLAARTAGYFLDGGASGALTTQATTPGGVARDAAIGGITGGVLGNAAHAAGAAFKAGPQAATQAADQFGAAERLRASTGQDLRPGLAETGGYGSRVAAGGLSEGIAGGAILGNRAVARNAAMEQVRNQAADALAPAGETAQPINAVRGQLRDDLADFDSRAADQERTAYDGARALVPQGTKIKSPELLKAVQEKVSEMKETPGWQSNPQVGFFNSLARQLRTQSFTPQGLRDLRTNIYANMTDKAAARRTWGQLSAPLSRDIDTGLRGAGLHDAADAFAAADAAHGPLMAQRADVDAAVGRANNVSEEGVQTRLTGMLKTDADRFNRTLGAMSPDNAARARASIVRDLGQTRPGVSTGESEFSPSTFLTRWNDQNLSPQAKAALIPDASIRQQMDDLATIAQGSRRALGRANNSHTGGAWNVLHTLGTLASGHAAWGSMGMSLLGETAGAKLLTSPAMAKAAMMAGRVAQPAITGAGAVAAKAGQKSVPAVSGYLMDIPGRFRRTDGDPQ